MVGVMVAVAGGRLSFDDVSYMLDHPSPLNWNGRAKCMPPAGLYLKEIHYDKTGKKLT